ncbi:probable G-protein coupled receptor 141 [Triplophysa dalaica]|uniref:probable G-protein coupled receptor 141 n=1 Tax=Triplophysa dalaica TaxID=1582913 RepID=UPI0024DF9B4D|nr:probable G-protein coupled receptor 141 [Triplophysa dalaica]XP_056599563.1 probable G-protein coupled receptor 141 [Triplophysa dalaica]
MTGNNTNDTHHLPKEYISALLVIYIFIFLGGTLNVVLMSCMLQSQRHLSFTNVSVINLIAVHSLFLFTVPFRIFYYISDTWTLGIHFCKIVSVMIHAHMYLAFIFYIFLLIVRYMENFSKQPLLNFHRVLHATIASTAVWLVIFATIFPPTMLKYGLSANDTTQCFNFGDALDQNGVKILNYVICTVVLLVWSVLVCFQINFLLHVSKTHGTFERQEFWLQMKNVVFLLIILFFFVPYQIFRIYYISDNKNPELRYKNEIFLALTAFSCFDMIVFASRDIYKYFSSRGCTCCL